MRVLIYTTDFLPTIGGIESVLVSLSEGLVRRGAGSGEVEVIVVTRRAADGFDDRALPFRVVRRPGLRSLVPMLREADLIHVAGPAFVPMLFGLLLRKPVVVEHHGFQAICPNGQLFYEPKRMPCPGHFMAGRHVECLRCNARLGNAVSLKMWLLTFPRRWLCRWVAAHITPTRWLATLLRLPRTSVVWHGVPESGGGRGVGMFRPPLTFVFVGRLVSTKGVQTLLQAAHLLKGRGFEFRLKIIGDGPERGRLEDQARAMQLADFVVFLGSQPKERVEENLAEAAAVVMPSLGGEVFGLVAAENMMRKHLLVVSDLGSLAEVVGPAGLRFAPGDAAGLEKCLEQVLRSPGLASELGEQAHARCLEFFREERMIDEHLAVYRKVLSGRGVAC